MGRCARFPAASNLGGDGRCSSGCSLALPVLAPHPPSLPAKCCCSRRRISADAASPCEDRSRISTAPGSTTAHRRSASRAAIGSFARTRIFRGLAAPLARRVCVASVGRRQEDVVGSADLRALSVQRSAVVSAPMKSGVAIEQQRPARHLPGPVATLRTQRGRS